MAKTGTRLTGRGAALLILGAAASVGAAWLGERDLLWITLTVALLPLAAFLYLLAVRPRISHERSVAPDTVAVGDSARVVLNLANESPYQASALRFIDRAPPAVGGGANFLIARGFGRWSQAVAYNVESTQRGRYEVGPLMATASDPFALAQSTIKAEGEASLLRVTPRIWRLDSLAGGASMGTAEEGTPVRVGQAGQDDVLVREHRHGDDLRRVHWRLTAKQGELMVRLEEHPWDPSSTLIVDTRREAHRGGGPTGSFEWVISAVASIGSLLAEGRHRLSVVAPSGLVFDSGHSVGETAKRAMIDAMTDLEESEESWLGKAVDDPATLTTAATIVAATGLLTASDAAAMVAASARARSQVALVPDPSAWDSPDPEHEDACRLLLNHGWQVERYRPRDTVTDVWERVT